MLRHILLALSAPLALSACTTIEAAAPQAALSQGVVSAADPRAAEAGAAMLRQGGTATDAAIATMLALTVVEPQSSGIGGGGFYLRGTPEGEVVTLDGREKAPAAATPEWFLDEDGAPLPFPRAVLTGLSIGVPGNIALAAEAHDRYGKLGWEQLFQPAIALARDGWEITPRFVEFLQFAQNRAGLTDSGRALFYDAQGNPLPAGTVVRNPTLAATLEHIAAAGPEAFYNGEWAEGMAATIAEATPRDGRMTAVDIADYSAVWRQSPCGTYREYRICGMGPPSSGATTVFAVLKQLEGFDLGVLGPDSPVAWHLFAESQRLAYADREIYLADNDFLHVPVAGLMDDDYLRQRGALISANARMANVEAGTPPGARAIMGDGAEPVESGTSHFVAVDAWGTAVSYTSTIEGPFGSGHMYGGFYLNNELTDFSFVPERDGLRVANRVQGSKRPRSSMAPTLVYGPDGELVLAIGAAGGGTIPVQVAKALMGVIDFGLPVEQAIALPGLYSPGDTIAVEEDSPLLAMRADWEALGHTVTARRMPFKANAAQLVGGIWVGAADPRSEGAAATP
ncbi:gamma-glutamyltransferase [Alteraurantiacibacter aquimixticola]|uniref:Glutathione hydrolase proenzyme n=1 Tax=Alteraurantiacibacter aquimixticola TaxID=2489173 RepID=A0A4T3EX74_9SPHN|nr:gamma-glutamyltransferase [Alteraurantiacibacter aquimixticola]TIX49113.1 gamma-glutamyltransferase [Alteraurantiacibacter aquimixticola]